MPEECRIDMDVSENSGTPKISILIGFCIINHPFWGTPIFGNTHMDGHQSLKSPLQKSSFLGSMNSSKHSCFVQAPCAFPPGILWTYALYKLRCIVYPRHPNTSPEGVWMSRDTSVGNLMTFEH